MTKSILFWLLTCVFLTTSNISEAQHPDRMRHIGALMNLEANDWESQTYIATFVEGLQKRGWTVGRNVQIDYRWTAGDPNRIRKYAEELVALAPDVILTVGGSQVGPLRQVTRSVPIVFVRLPRPWVAASSTAWRNRGAARSEWSRKRCPTLSNSSITPKPSSTT